jgi:hypothetical protein
MNFINEEGITQKSNEIGEKGGNFTDISRMTHEIGEWKGNYTEIELDWRNKRGFTQKLVE